MYADDLLTPFAEQTMALLPPVTLFDAHTHIGVNDPDGFKCTANELLATLTPSGSRAVVFPMHEPGGYPAANDHVLAAAAASDGRLVAFCRVDPRAEPLSEIRRCVAAGARGIKLHPRAEHFDLDDPGVLDIVKLADEEHLPILVHAGRGIPALGAHVLEFARQFPRARFILAHCAVCDLAWIWQRIHEYPNVFFDTAWFSAADQLAVYSHIPPGQILYATDIPFGTPQLTVIASLRPALQAGLTAAQLRSVAGGQIERIVAREETIDLGPAVGDGRIRRDPLLARVEYFTEAAFGIAIGGGENAEMIDLARLATLVGDDAPQAPLCEAIRELLALALSMPLGDSLTERFAHIHLLVTAAAIAATPDVPVA
ncbi:MAG TPA: amidohydrolase family protein [Solirubrobacteraceae bacterium]|nr:amidohydrolase family protein [Solirubrobacteraceae bacterium]